MEIFFSTVDKQNVLMQLKLREVTISIHYHLQMVNGPFAGITVSALVEISQLGIRLKGMDPSRHLMEVVTVESIWFLPSTRTYGMNVHSKILKLR
jgi:hypothetical protein